MHSMHIIMEKAGIKIEDNPEINEIIKSNTKIDYLTVAEIKIFADLVNLTLDEMYAMLKYFEKHNKED